MKIRKFLPVFFLCCIAAISFAAGFEQQIQTYSNLNAQVGQQSQVTYINRSDNPDFISPAVPKEPEKFNTIKTLVPYEDLYKVLQQDIGKYFILPLDEFEQLKKAKEAWLASQTKPITAPPPVIYQINSARLEGKLLENFAHIDAFFKIETYTEDWHEIPVLWGSLAVEEVRLNGVSTTLKTNWVDNNTRRVNFGKLSKQNILQNYYQASLSSSETLSQNNWKDTIFSLPIKGKGSHECRISFMVPVQNNDDLYNLQFNMAQIPLAFFRLEAENFTMSVDSTTFKDFSVEESNGERHSCAFIGWLGATSELNLKWRRKYTRSEPKKPIATEIKPEPGVTASATTDPVAIEEPKPVIMPLIYARSNTLISLGETAVHGFKTIDYTISKAPVSSFSFLLPANVEITSVNADRPHSYRLLREGESRKLRVEFMAGREDTCQIEIAFESPIDLTAALTELPEVSPIGVERELGNLAIEALTSVEVQPGNDDDNPLNGGIYPLDPLEVPQPLKDRASRPILLAYRQNARSANILLRVKRYQDVNQQTVVADRMEVKSTFTTNQTCNTQVVMKIRNNNKQYLQLQLASGTEVISAMRNRKPVKLVASKNDGKVQIPLEMSQTIGKPVEMELLVSLKHPVDEIKWRGSLEFMPPLVDIPVSRFDWQIFAPEQYYLYNFKGTVKDSLTRKDPFFFRGFMRLLRLAWNIVSSPEALFTVIFLVLVIMLVLARGFLLKVLSVIYELICGIFSFVFSGKGIRLAELMIVFAIIGILAAISVPNFRKAREQARHKACYANIRVIQGAVEMYNMDNEQMMSNLDLNKLVQGKYLKSHVSLPEQGCRYENRGNLAAGGYVYCRLHGAIETDEELKAREHQIADISARSDYDEMARNEVQMERKMKSAMPAPTSSGGASSFGAVKSKGSLPISKKFVMTSNHYSLERELVIADIASNGALVPNRTCPAVTLNYVWFSALKAGEILAFILALFAGLYFISGSFMQYSIKITFSAVIILFLSLIDLQLKTIGDMANLGFWIAIIGGVIWKFFWLLTKIKVDLGGPDGSDDSDKPVRIKKRRNLDEFDDQDDDKDEIVDHSPSIPGGLSAGKASPTLLLVLFMLFFVGFSAFSFAATDVREIRVMAPFKELEKVVPAGDRVVIIPEKDYEYLRDIIEKEPPVIKAPQSYRFENVIYKGVIEEKGVRFKAEFNLNLFNEGWKNVGLLTTQAIPSYAGLNGKPLSLTTINGDYFQTYGFITDATGTCKVNLDFFIPLSSSEYKHTSKFHLPMVPVCLSTLEIRVNEKDCEAWIDPGVLKPVEKAEDHTMFSALLPPTNSLSFELYRNVPAAPKAEEVKPTDEEAIQEKPVVIVEKTRITSRELSLLYFKEGFVSGTTSFDLKIKGGSGIASLTFLIPEKIRILKVENKLIEDWKMAENSGERKLEVFFKSKIRGSTDLVIEFEQEIQNLKNEEYSVPEITLLDAEQSFGILGIGCLQTLEIAINTTPQGYSPIVSAEFLKEWKRGYPEKTPYAFKYLRHPNSLILTISRPEDISQQTAVIDRAEAMTLLNEDGYLLTRVIYEVRNNSQQFLKVRLPEVASKPAELWSTQVAGESVRAGFDDVHGVYNLPIVRSPIEAGESKSFPVEIVYVIRTDEPLQAFNHIAIKLPQTHLSVSELNWMLYLPEGYELMREKGTMDRMLTNFESKFLNDSSYFASVNQVQVKKQQAMQMRQYQKKQMVAEPRQDRVFESAGLLPVRFKIPTTSWATSFTMLQIEPDGKVPYIEGMLVNPRKGLGFFFQAIMILIGILSAISLIMLFISNSRYLWFLFLTLQVAIVAVAIYLKLYQADHFAQLGFAATMTLYLLYKFFAYKPKES